MVELTIANPTGKLSFFNFGFVYLFLSFWLLCLSVLGITLFVWLPLGVLCQFKMPFTRNVLAFTLHATSWGMSKVFPLITTSSPKLPKLFCLCKCLLLLFYTLILSPLLLGVGFGLNFISFWGCLKHVSCVFICFIRCLEPSKTRSCKLFVYPLTKLLEIWWTSQNGSFSS